MGQLGDTLKERRVSLGISIENAEADTKIRGRLLEALEAGEYDKLPNPGYVRGYVSSYARYLELDPMPLLAMYRAETGASRYHEINLPEERVEHRHEQHEVPWRVALIAFAIVAALVLAGWVVYRATHPSSPPPLPATNGSASPSGTAPQQNQTAAPPFTLVVTAKPNGASQLKVTVDGGTAYNGTLEGGESKTFNVADTAVISVDKPSAVTITRDGKLVKLPATSPAKVTLKAGQQ